MILEVTDNEKELLLEILEAVSRETIHGLHHTDTHDYKEILKQRLETVDKLKEKLEDLDKQTKGS